MRHKTLLPSTPKRLKAVPKVESNPDIDLGLVLTRILLFLILLSGGMAISMLALLGLTFKKTTPLTIDQKGAPHLSRPLNNNEVSKPEAVRRSIENHLPRLYTWIGVLQDANDPTGTRFVKDEGMSVSLYDPKTQQTSVVGKVPTTVFDEQFYLAEPIRESTMAAIAQLIEKTKGVIWQTDPNNPALGTSYRFRFRQRPSFPEEVSPGRWKTVVTGDIIKVSPTLGIAPTEKAVQTFSFEIYVVEVSRQPVLFSDNHKDLVEYGTADGFNIDLFIPYNPSKETVPSPK
ncbi:MAG: hypothetical protein HC852_14445 [Acaryochloridaceae cyanobacterium RU_4_10]|nr:hypothetical protein [Acaryochloridaceae cyanobacterium RU_4_10]